MTGAAPRFVAVLDVGKTNVKLVLHDLGTGADLALRSMPNGVAADGPYPHFDVEAIWRFVLDALREIAALHPVEAISVTTHGASGALVAADGTLALPVLDYEHPIGARIAADYAAVRPPFSETLSPPLPDGLNLGAQIFWLQRRFPAEFARIRHILTYPQYWAFRLTGVAATEITSLTCHTDLWAPRRGDFSSLVDRLGWRPLFAPLRSAFDVLGPLRPEIAQQTGVGGAVPVHCGLHDSNASLLPHLVRRPAPFGVVSTGTWVAALAIGGEPAGLDGRRNDLVNADAFGDLVPSCRFMGGREFDLLTAHRFAEPERRDVGRVLDGGVMALPSFVPGTGPFPERAGRWTQDPETLTERERSAAALLYLALMTEAALDLIGAAGPIVVEGPFARDPAFAALLEELTARPVEIAAGATGTSAGAALLAAGVERARASRAAAPSRRVAQPRTGLRRYAALWRERVACGRTVRAGADGEASQ